MLGMLVALIGWLARRPDVSADFNRPQWIGGGDRDAATGAIICTRAPSDQSQEIFNAPSHRQQRSA